MSGDGNGTSPWPYSPSKGPPRTRPMPSKKPHRRSPHACDECRLRKRACDAAQPCGPCRRSGTNCTYHFRRPVPRPTSRIRTLQDHLRQARRWIQQIKDETPGTATRGLDLDECLRTLDFTIPDHASPEPPPSQSSISSRLVPASKKHGNMLTGCDRFVQGDAGIGYFYGSYSDVSFILRTIELLGRGPPDSEHHQLSMISDFLSRPLQHQLDAEDQRKAAYDLPQDVDGLLDVVFTRGELMLSFLPHHQLREAALNPRSPSVSKERLSLLHLCLALGYLHNAKEHQNRGCQDVLQHANKHFHIGTACLGLPNPPQNLTSLQAILCAVVFLFSSYRCTTAHPFIGTACSLALRLGLFSTLPKVSLIPIEERKMRMRLLATVSAFDMLESLILDLPPFIHRHLLSHARFTELAIEAEAEGDLITAALLRQSSLLDIPLSMRSHGRHDTNSSSHSDSDDIRLFQTAYEECQRWRRDASSLMAKLGSNANHHGVKMDLDMTYHLAQIILFRPHLHYLRDMYAGKAISVAESYFALACIKVASSTVVRAEEFYQQPQLLPQSYSWLTIYTVFSSAMCLVFLVAAHPATTLPSIAWQKANSGIRIIAAMRCADDISATCLEILKMVTHELSETIYMDFEKIETSTIRNCDTFGGDFMSKPEDWAQNDHVPDDDALQGLRQHMSIADGGVSDKNSHKSKLAEDMENEADKMLEQAEALPVELDLEDLLWISDSE